MTITHLSSMKNNRHHTMLKTGLMVMLAVSSGIPGAEARECYVDFNGYRHCRLSNGVRAGIAIAIFVIFMLLLFVALFTRRRRIQRQNMTYVTYDNNQAPNQQQQQQYPYGNTPYDPTNAASNQQYQQYPPAYNQGAFQGAYAPPQGPPPEVKYEPPRSPPPAQSKV